MSHVSNMPLALQLVLVILMETSSLKIRSLHHFPTSHLMTGLHSGIELNLSSPILCIQ